MVVYGIFLMWLIATERKIEALVIECLLWGERL